MQYKIVADSSANMRAFDGVDFANVPLKIITKEKEYTDDAELDVAQMIAELKAYKGTSGTSCPNVYDYLEAFGDAEQVFVITITSGLSGSCNAAQQAAQEYMILHPERKACVFDSLSAGPELRLIAEKLREGMAAQLSFEEIENNTRAYMRTTYTNFALKSLHNLARNGRVSHAVAGIAGVLGIWVIGSASEEGTLQQDQKSRGEKRAVEGIFAEMKKRGYAGGKVRLSHCQNEHVAEQLTALIHASYPQADIFSEPTTALCSFYAEQGGLILGYEGANRD